MLVQFLSQEKQLLLISDFLVNRNYIAYSVRSETKQFFRVSYFVLDSHNYTN